MKIVKTTWLLPLLATCSLAAEAEWDLVTTTKGIQVWNREKAGTSIKEAMTSGVVEAPTWRVLKVITDHDH